MTLILLTNDDGIHAPGLHALRRKLEAVGTVEVIAPHVEQSGTAHSVSIDRPLTLRQVRLGDEVLGYSVDGSPADCVKLGIAEHLHRLPDLLVSGINRGVNTGVNVLYSGTVAAAIEGAMLGVPSIAVSLATGEGTADFEAAGRIAAPLIEKLRRRRAPSGALWNINIPALPEDKIKGVRLTRQSTQVYVDSYVKRIDPRGRTYYWINGKIDIKAEPADTDVGAIRDGCVSITPLSYDLTSRGDWADCAEWLNE